MIPSVRRSMKMGGGRPGQAVPLSIYIRMQREAAESLLYNVKQVAEIPCATSIC